MIGQGLEKHGHSYKGTNGKSQGIVPFLKVANDTAVAVNQEEREKEQCVLILKLGT